MIMLKSFCFAIADAKAVSVQRSVLRKGRWSKRRKSSETLHIWARNQGWIRTFWVRLKPKLLIPSCIFSVLVYRLFWEIKDKYMFLFIAHLCKWCRKMIFFIRRITTLRPSPFFFFNRQLLNHIRQKRVNRLSL